MELSGHDDWVEFYRDTSLDITGNKLTIEFWIYPKKWINRKAIITKGNHQFGLIQTHNDSLEFYIYNKKRVAAVCQLPKDWENKWHHVAAVQPADGAGPRLYIDGVRIAVTNDTATDVNSWGSELGGLDKGFIGCANKAGDSSETEELAGFLSQIEVFLFLVCFSLFSQAC